MQLYPLLSLLGIAAVAIGLAEAERAAPSRIERRSLQSRGKDSTSTKCKTRASKQDRFVAGYFPAYHWELHPLEELDVSLYTDIYFFGAATAGYHNGSWGFVPAGTAEQINATVWDSLAKAFVPKCKKAGVRPILSIGGWSGSVHFSDAVGSAENRTGFLKSVVGLVDKYDFAGVDIDWEYPSQAGIGCNTNSPNDLENLTTFLESLAKERPDITLSMAVSVAGLSQGANATVATDLSRLASVLDNLNIMAYDIYGSWSPTSGPVGALYDTCADPSGARSVSTAVKLYKSAGFKPEQLVVGIPGYARSYPLLSSTLTPKTVGNETTYFYQKFNSTMQPGGPTDDAPGTDVCGAATSWGGGWLVSDMVKRGWLTKHLAKGQNGYIRFFDECSQTPFLWNNSTRMLYAYDDTESTKAKAEYVKANGYGGVFFFDTNGPIPDTVRAAYKTLR